MACGLLQERDRKSRMNRSALSISPSGILSVFFVAIGTKINPKLPPELIFRCLLKQADHHQSREFFSSLW
jgi:hypothetical protein